jgi:glutathione peroxidase
MSKLRVWAGSAVLVTMLGLTAPTAALAGYTFTSIDGGQIDLDDYLGQPVLVANTASLCAYTPQYDDLQALYDRYEKQGLVVLAVPSNDFAQELASGAEVKDFCAVNFNLTLPMTDITSVRGGAAHPFYAWLRETQGFEPTWNFNKVLLGPDGAVVATWGSGVNPMSRRVTSEVERLLP